MEEVEITPFCVKCPNDWEDNLIWQKYIDFLNLRWCLSNHFKGNTLGSGYGLDKNKNCRCTDVYNVFQNNIIELDQIFLYLIESDLLSFKDIKKLELTEQELGIPKNWYLPIDTNEKDGFSIEYRNLKNADKPVRSLKNVCLLSKHLTDTSYYYGSNIDIFLKAKEKIDHSYHHYKPITLKVLKIIINFLKYDKGLLIDKEVIDKKYKGTRISEFLTL